MHVKTSICETYIIGKISIFISYYFESHLSTKINRVPTHDDGGEMCNISHRQVRIWYLALLVVLVAGLSHVFWGHA
jgi:hypothetical protein